MTSFPKLSYVCPIAWTSMRGDERERYCSKCARTVVNVSLLTSEQREALLANPPPGGLCVAYYQRLAGEMVSAENPLSPAESSRVVQWGVAALSLSAVALAVNITPGSGEALVNARDATAATVSTVYDGGREAVENIAIRLGLKPKPAPTASMIMGVMICPIPSSSSPTPTTLPLPAQTPDQTTTPDPVPIATPPNDKQT